VGNRSIRVRCSQLDPARANRWRHPVIRLLGEYILGFFSAINRAPISRRDRWRCRKVLVLWILGHANPMYRLKFLSSPDLAVREVGESSRAARVARKVNSVLGRLSSTRRQENKTS
jgi:hypothetical protein